MKLNDRKASVLRTKTDDELKDTLLQLKKEQFNLRFQRANMINNNPVQHRFLRRKVALIKTILNERRAAAPKAA